MPKLFLNSKVFAPEYISLQNFGFILIIIFFMIEKGVVRWLKA